MTRTLAAIAAVLMLAGCSGAKTAEIAPESEKSWQAVSVSTPGVTGARCSMQNTRAAYSVVAPGSVTVENSEAPLTVYCQKGRHFGGAAVLAPHRYSGKDGGYAHFVYPASVSVPMRLNSSSLETDVRVF